MIIDNRRHSGSDPESGGVQKQLLAGLFLAAMFGFFPAWAVADEPTLPDVAISGFGTLGVLRHDGEGVKFRRDISQGSGIGAEQFSLKADSMLGVQVDARLSKQFDVAVQAVSRQNWEGNYRPDIAMAYLKFKPSEDATIRAGRLILESYLQGDSAEIGYANLMVRQPIIFYPRNVDGMDAEIRRSMGGGVLRIKGAAGWTHGWLMGTGAPYNTAGSKSVGAGVEYTREGWVGRYYMSRMVNHDETDELKPDALLPTALGFAPNGRAIMERLSMKNREFNLRTLALAYDSGPLQAVVSHSIVASPHWSDWRIFYASAGYRFGQVTPYVSYASQHASRNIIATGLPNGAGFDALNRGAAMAQAGVFSNQIDFALGARYDLILNMAIKLQADHIRYEDSQNIFDPALLAEPAVNRSTKGLTLFSVALDFVF